MHAVNEEKNADFGGNKLFYNFWAKMNWKNFFDLFGTLK
jgi:hypothetical protein